MKTERDFKTYNRYGANLKIIKGVLQEKYGTFIFCKNGKVIQAADIKVPGEAETRTVYLESTDTSQLQ